MPPHDSPKPMLIGGEQVTNANEPLVSVNPATGAINHTVCAAASAEVDLAVDTAARAAAHPTWRDLQPHQRAAVLHRIGDLMQRDAELFAHLQMIENGKVCSECMAQVESAAATFRYYAAVCETLGSELHAGARQLPVDDRARALWRRRGHHPLEFAADDGGAEGCARARGRQRHHSQALRADPPRRRWSSAASRCEAGLPAGRAERVAGHRRDSRVRAGRAPWREDGLVHRRYRQRQGASLRLRRRSSCRWRWSSAESRRTSCSPMPISQRGRRRSLAESSKAAASRASPARACSCSGRSGRVIDSLLAKARALRIDLPDAPGAQMGPIASFAHRERIERHGRGARAAGARVSIGCAAAPCRGHASRRARSISRPCCRHRQSRPIAQQEIFGPVLCVLAFETKMTLSRRPTTRCSGLLQASGPPTTKGLACRAALEAGTVWINTYKQLSISTPFGGFKESGVGREKGLDGHAPVSAERRASTWAWTMLNGRAQLLFPNDGISQHSGRDNR